MSLLCSSEHAMNARNQKLKITFAKTTLQNITYGKQHLLEDQNGIEGYNAIQINLQGATIDLD